MNKIVLIGCGNVGMAYAYALMTQNTNVDELVLIDINKEKAEGEVLDLRHSAVFRPNKCLIYAGDYKDCKDATLVVITAGKNQEVGETRTDLITKNAKVFKDIISSVKQSGFDGIYLIATNPLDVMTYATYKYAGVEPNKVIGSGTVLDTARLKDLISEKIRIDSDNIHSFVIGEHGDSELVTWSISNVGLSPLSEYLTKEQQKEIQKDVRNSAYEIINKKGNTAYGIGVCLVKITEAIFDDDNTIMTVSSFDPETGIYYGYPSVITKRGTTRYISLNLNKEEESELQESINAITKNIQNI